MKMIDKIETYQKNGEFIVK